MLARLGSQKDLDREGYIFEPKLDGIRAICSKDGDLKLYNRSCREITSRYPEFEFSQAIRADRCMLDGEIVLYDSSGNPDFTELMRRHLGTGRVRRVNRALRFAVFDILAKDGEDLTELPLLERKEILANVLDEHPHLEQTVYTPDGHRLWQFVEKRAVEGVVAKRETSRYEVGQRSISWIKIKAFQTIDAVIVGYTTEKRPVSALAVAVYDGPSLRFIGKVGIGLSERDVRMLRELLEPLRVEEPVCACPKSYEINWVEPRHVCEVRYMEFGTQGMLRNPTYLHLRPDKVPEECTIEADSI